jgi:hypothetical protein
MQTQKLQAKNKNFPLFDNKSKKIKPVMVDAWTQTTPRTHEENRRRRKERELYHKNKEQVQQ